MPYPRRRVLPLLVLAVFPTAALPQATPPALVRDINPGLNREERSGEPQNFVEMGGIVYFHSFDPAHGEELWRTDGTEGGTWLFKDFLPGPNSSYAGASTLVVGKTLYFLVSNGSERYDLWKSDGTAAGTVRFLPGFDGYLQPFAVGGTLYLFRNCSETGSCELWKSDGTIAGTVKVASLALPPSPPGLFFGVSPLGRSGGPVFFFKFYSQHGELQELWRSDGTAAGTFPVRLFATPGQQNALVSYGQVGGTLFFNGWDAEWGYALWKSDGTAAGTVRLKNVDPGSMVDAGGTLYFSGRDDASGWELWKSNGTAAGTVRLKDIVPGPGGSFASMIGRVGETLLILAWRPETSYELWQTDGTDAGTVLVRELAPGPDDYVDWLVLVDRLFYFTMDDGVHGLELWKSDGTAAGTVLVKDIVPGPGFPTILGPGGAAGKLFFWGDDGVHGHELWMSDGTAEGTVPLKDLVRATSSIPAELTVSGDQLFFLASDGSQGTELWKTDGTAQGTVLAHDLSPGPNGSYLFELTDVDGTLFFDAWKNQIWRTDGTPGGLALELTLPFIQGVAEAGDRLFVDAGELYAAGTGLVKDIRPGSQGSRISHMTEMGGTLFFRADDGGGSGLWRSDGTAPGTFEIAPVPADPLTAAGDALFFTVLEESSWTYSLWTSDGTLGGTFKVASWSPGDLPYELTDVDGTLFFGLALRAGGQELWKSDGTPAGTVRVQRIPGSRSPLAELTAVRGSLFFSADGPGGRELWRSDGTGPGTRRVADIYPGNQGSDPAGIVDAQGWAVFAATDRVHGREVWMSDGTQRGTFLVGDVAPGARSSRPEELTVWNGKVYFSADDGATGIELWSFEVAAPPDPKGR